VMTTTLPLRFIVRFVWAAEMEVKQAALGPKLFSLSG
jgi:hypothetical protein